MPRNWKPAIVAAIALVLILAGVGFAYARYGGKIAERLRWKPTAATAPLASAPSGDSTRGANDAASAASGVTAAPNSAGANSKSNDLAAAAPTATAVATDPLELTLQTSKLVDVAVVADGATVFSGPIDAGDKRKFEARDAFDITSSDSSAIILELNGHRVPAFGQMGLPGSVKLTRNDLKTPSGESH
jgi:hypothetical protein